MERKLELSPEMRNIAESEQAPSEERSFKEDRRMTTWLSFESKKQCDLYHDFLVLQSSKPIILGMSVFLTLAFGVYLMFAVPFLWEESHMAQKGIAIARVLRFLVCAFAWLDVHFLGANTCASNVRAMWCGDQFILWNAVGGSLILCLRSYNGACEDGEIQTMCNPRHEDYGLPADTLLAHLLFIAFLPVIFKAHSSAYLLLSYCVTFTGIIAALVIAHATADIVLALGSLVSVGVMMLDHERNLVKMFLVLQGQQRYYNQLLCAERSRVTVESQKDEFRDLIGSVAHDLKTPLQAIAVELDGLQSEVNSVKQLLNSPPVTALALVVSGRIEEAEKYIVSLRDIYQFATMSINRAIEFRKTAAGVALMPNTETFHLPRALNWALAHFVENPSGIEVRLESSMEQTGYCPYLLTDKNWLTENILTLLSNAAKFTTKGNIVLRCSVVPAARRKSTSKETTEGMAVSPDDERDILVEVEDSGIGVEPDRRESIFRPFGLDCRHTGGTGLGLYTLSKRMEVILGECGTRSRRDGSSGSCFWFSFPYTPDESAWLSSGGSSESTGSEASDGLRSEEAVRKVVLVVDDSTLILKTTSRMLAKEGFDVKTAQNGEEALLLLQSQKYFFVLTDIQMPVMDGLEMAKRLRELEATAGQEQSPQLLIGTSANSDAETRDDALACGMNAFIPKPVRAFGLMKCLPTEVFRQDSVK